METLTNSSITPETNLQVCPLCQSEMKYFFINYNKKVLMCNSTKCDYPFGYTDMVYFKEDEKYASDEELSDITDIPRFVMLTPTCSMISSTPWSDIDNQSKGNETDKANYCSRQQDFVEDNKVEPSISKQLMKHIESMTQLNEKFRKKNDRAPGISNEKWIKKLMDMQMTSGVSLVTPMEMKLINKKQATSNLGQVKIDINIGNSSIGAPINIKIDNFSPES